jgi:hypothetical protein
MWVSSVHLRRQDVLCSQYSYEHRDRPGNKEQQSYLDATNNSPENNLDNLKEQATRRARSYHCTAHSRTRPTPSPESKCFPSGAQANVKISAS